MKKYLVATGIIAVLVGCGSASPSDDDSKRLDDNADSTATATQKAAPQVKAKEITEGDWEVGKKEDTDSGVITAGIYVITAINDGTGCYWQTSKNFDNTLDSIIANGNIEPGKVARVNVKSSYAGLSLSGDCLAKKKKP
jgi:hypothetical protein